MQAICKKFIYAFYIIKLVIAMRKIRNIIKEKAGVSPIIAIILMVAITVVLAATIYVWVSGMGGGGEASKIALTIAQTDYDNSTGKAEFKVYDVSGGPGWEDVKIVINGTVVWNGSDYPDDWTLTGITQGKPIQPGDTFTIEHQTDVKPGNTMIIYDLNTGKMIWSSEIHY